MVISELIRYSTKSSFIY